MYVSGGFDDALADRLLDHPNEDVRTWTIRFLGDAKKVSPALQERLVHVARTDPSPTVRSQLACSCKRLPAKDGLPVVRELLRRREDANDPHIPLLLWWAVEDKAVRDRELVLGLLDSPEAWRAPITSKFLVERLARRYLAEGGEADLKACARLLASAPGDAERNLLLAGMEKALEGRRLEKVPAALEKQLAELWQKRSGDVRLVRLALRLGSAEAYDRALHLAADPKATDADRASLIEVLGQAGKAECVPVLLKVLTEAKSDALRRAALSALQPFPEPRVAEAVLALYPKLPAGLRGQAQTLLASRPASALAFLRAVDAGRVNPKEVPLDQVRRLAQHRDERALKIIEKHWGKITPATAGEKQARIRSVLHILNLGKGDAARGKALFTKNCATCHTLFGEGNKVGPDLTGADRKDRELLVTHVVDPSAVIRPEYVAFQVATKDGRTLTGLIVESSPSAITLLNEKNERTVLAREKIEEMAASPVSLMPEKILDPLSDQEICDLFAYVQGDGPKAKPGPPRRPRRRRGRWASLDEWQRGRSNL